MDSALFRRYEWCVIAFAAAVFLSGIISPPSLMDDVDASQAIMARNMFYSGDWVSARLGGVLFLDKAPMKYWMTLICYAVFGAHDWAARMPGAFSAIALCWLLVRLGRWAGSPKGGFYAGLFLATCIGLFLFTRIVIPDVILTLSMTVALWAFLRALDEQEPRPRLWANVLAASLAAGMLIKGLIGLAFPAGIMFVYLLIARRLFDRQVWRRLHPFTGLLIFLAIAAPWHVLAILRNPPYFDFTMHSTPFQWRGFFWFYFINDQVLRFLNARYPRDYNTVPRLAFWGLHLVWFFPWSVYLPQIKSLPFRPVDRAGRLHLLCLCWIGLVMLFFTLSTTQEYYSMPIYPAVALLLGSGLAAGGGVRVGARIAGTVAACALAAIVTLLILVRGLPSPGDISMALTQNPDAYTLSMGHMQDLTIASFAYLRAPLALAGLACLVGVAGTWFKPRHAVLSLALMMVIFFQAARIALAVFDPYLTSRPLAEAMKTAPKGTMISYGQYYTFSSMWFYFEDKTLMVNGRYYNLEYGSYAPGAPQVFLNDSDFVRIWSKPDRHYLAITKEDLPKVEKLVEPGTMHLLVSSGGKYIYSNLELPAKTQASMLKPPGNRSLTVAAR